MAAITTASRVAAQVREPSNEDLQGFDNLADILVWAGVKGNPQCGTSQCGALLMAIAGDEFKTMSAAEFASISSEDFESALVEWKFSQYDDDYEHGVPDCDLVPNALIKGRARAAHRATRSWQQLDFSTENTNAYNVWVHESMMQPPAQPPAAPPPAAPTPTGETVRLHETVDFTRVREVQMMTEKDRLICLDLFPAEKPSLAQMTGLLDMLKCGAAATWTSPYGEATTSEQPAASDFVD